MTCWIGSVPMPCCWWVISATASAASLNAAGLELPLACVLGNHDAAKDGSGRTLRHQLELLGDRHCGWGLRELRPPGLAVVGARPGTAGGGFHLSKAVRAVYGPVGLQASAERISRAALAADPALPLVLLAHSGPSGLGSQLDDPCGRDWKAPACDWGDQDLSLAINQIRRRRRRCPWWCSATCTMPCATTRANGAASAGMRRARPSSTRACVPRHGVDQQGRALRHFSWVIFRDGELQPSAIGGMGSLAPCTTSRRSGGRPCPRRAC